jgi:hypothetical protein
MREEVISRHDTDLVSLVGQGMRTCVTCTYKITAISSSTKQKLDKSAQVCYYPMFSLDQVKERREEPHNVQKDK